MAVSLFELGGQAFSIVAVLKSPDLKRKITAGQIGSYKARLPPGLSHRMRWGRKCYDFHRGRSRSDHTQFTGGPIGQIDDAPPHKRSPIIDADIQFAAIPEIVDAHDRTKG